MVYTLSQERCGVHTKSRGVSCGVHTKSRGVSYGALHGEASAVVGCNVENGFIKLMHTHPILGSKRCFIKDIPSI